MVKFMMETITQLALALPRLMMIFAMFQTYFPFQFTNPFSRYTQKLIDYLYAKVHITIPEYQSDSFERSRAYVAVERYLNANSAKQAKSLNANAVKDSENVVLTMSGEEEVLDEYQGIKLQWTAVVKHSNNRTVSYYPGGSGEEKRYFKLTFNCRDRKIVTERYLKHVLEEGKAIACKERQRRLYTNNSSYDWFSRRNWTQVPFQHPATFDSLAMDPVKKKEIVDDLLAFTQGKEYYEKIGKAWKRGYLLYGPPGTGKSTMIAAMANLLKYDIYDLELTSVEDNVQLKKLLIDTTSKSIVVIEDIDCSLDLTGKREEKKGDADPVEDKVVSSIDARKKLNKVTLSGLLNFIDGLWSASVGERIVIFTTNHVEKLDAALIRRGRMDKHIEMSYCCFESFKVLAKNYLGLEWHDLFDKVKVMLEEVKMSPADVAENLLPKLGGEDAETCLMRLIKGLEEAKQKAEEEEKRKVEELAKEQEEKEKKREEEEKRNADKLAEEEKLKVDKLAKETEGEETEDGEDESGDDDDDSDDSESSEDDEEESSDDEDSSDDDEESSDDDDDDDDGDDDDGDDYDDDDDYDYGDDDVTLEW